VLTGGGTGGHLYPAVSVARALETAGGGWRTADSTGQRADGHGTVAPQAALSDDQRLSCDFQPVFIGSWEGLEAEVVPREGFEFHAVASRKIRRAFSPDLGLSLSVLAWGTLQAGILLRRLRPAAVIGTGGYVSAGVVLAAALLRIPTLIHEQNAIPGRTNRLLGRIVKRVALTFPEAARYFPAGKTVVTGLPVRPDVARGERPRGLQTFGLVPERPTLLVLGGSLGARSLNRAARESLPLWPDSAVQILHQVGKRDWEEHRASLDDTPGWYHPVPYLEEMGDAYAVAELVVCRAGASTLAEVTLVGLPTVLVPYPHAHADHQTHNAHSLVAAGAGVLLPDSELSAARLVGEVVPLLQQPCRREQMAEASRRLGRPEAALAVLDLVHEMLGSSACGDKTGVERGAKRGAA
jgi:UDP-N-acetylglucosamine--N-acetylmuramyl-(pentapeptide) pyrophosphoryl-undecaprenol N-acetylglucosamine transferase